jgi:NAD(P)H-quinone oxidoreductase subunit 4
MGNIGKFMPTVFALFTIGALASLALPGMSGFVSELAVFVGMATSDVYSTTFRIGTVFLAAVGLMLTPIYLLSMLRQLFYATEGFPSCSLEPTVMEPGLQEAVCFGTSCVLPGDANYEDARPREVFIAACFIVPIIAIGLYPKLATQVYDATTVAINTQLLESRAEVAQSNPDIYANLLKAPAIADVEINSTLGVIR